MAEAAPPTTPRKSESSTIHSTPYNVGTATNAEFQKDEKLELVKKALWKDLSNGTISNVDFNAMLGGMITMIGDEYTLEHYLEQAVEFINAWDDKTSPSHSDSLEFRESLEEFCKAKNEKEMYDPLTDALNVILRHFRKSNIRPELPKHSHLDIIYKVNDPVVITSSRLERNKASKRKPDIITLTEIILSNLQGSLPEDNDWEIRVHNERTMRYKKRTQSTSKDDFPTPDPLTWLDPFKPLELKFEHAMNKKHLREQYDTKTELEQLDSLLIPASPEAFQPTPVASVSTPVPRPSGSKSRSALSNTPQSDQLDAPKSGQKRGSNTDESQPQKKAKTYSESRMDVTVQLAAYASERLLAAPWITRTPGIIIQNQKLYLWWFDKQHCFQSKGINFFKSLPHFVVLIVLFQRLELQDWGIAKEFMLTTTLESNSGAVSSKTRKAAQKAKSGAAQISSSNEISIRVGDHSFKFMLKDLKTDFVLFGRSTSTVEAVNLSDGKKCLLKFSWQEACRPREAVVIQEALRIGAKEGVVGNLPHLIAHAELEDTATAKLTELFGFARDSDQAKGSRVLCILAFDILEPITSLQGLDFWKAYWEIIACHYILWKGGIQHGDISVSNLMHRNGTGVLNDFDLARLTLYQHPRGFDRTGTTPFLALDLLTEEAQAGRVERRYRHDLESFLWVLMWIAACYDNGVEKIPVSHLSWLDDQTVKCRSSKKTMLEAQTITDSYLSLAPAIHVLRVHWKTYYDKRDKRFDDFNFFHSYDKSATRGTHPSPSRRIIDLELSDKQVLLDVLDAFTSHPGVDILRSDGLMPDLPLALFPTSSDDVST